METRTVNGRKQVKTRDGKWVNANFKVGDLLGPLNLKNRSKGEEYLEKQKNKAKKKWTDPPKTGSGAKDIKNKSKVEYDRSEKTTKTNRWGKTEKVAQPPNFKESVDASKTLKLGSSHRKEIDKTAKKIENTAKKAEDAKTYTKFEKAGKRQSSARNSVARQAYLRKKKNNPGLGINNKKTTTPKPEIKKVKPKANGKGPAKVKAGAGGNATGAWISFLEQLINR